MNKQEKNKKKNEENNKYFVYILQGYNSVLLLLPCCSAQAGFFSRQTKSWKWIKSYFSFNVFFFLSVSLFSTSSLPRTKHSLNYLFFFLLLWSSIFVVHRFSSCFWFDHQRTKIKFNKNYFKFILKPCFSIIFTSFGIK